MNIWLQFCEIFTKMSWVPAVLLIVGLVFMLVEVFVPGFGFFGITGILSIIAGIIVRIVNGLNVTQSVLMILLVILIFIAFNMIMVFSAKHGMLGHSGLFENKSSLATDYNKPNREIRKLVGRQGKTISPLNLGGKAKIRGRVYEVVSVSEYIEANTRIKVVEIKDNIIKVKKWFE